MYDQYGRFRVSEAFRAVFWLTMAVLNALVIYVALKLILWLPG